MSAGVAPLGGPVVAAAAVFPSGYRLFGLDDSKKITSEARGDAMAAELKREATGWADGYGEVEEIDRMNG